MLAAYVAPGLFHAVASLWVYHTLIVHSELMRWRGYVIRANNFLIFC